MRTVKFRGKDLETGEWIYGDLIQRMGYMPSIMYPYESNGKVRYIDVRENWSARLGQLKNVWHKVRMVKI